MHDVLYRFWALFILSRIFSMEVITTLGLRSIILRTLDSTCLKPLISQFWSIMVWITELKKTWWTFYANKYIRSCIWQIYSWLLKLFLHHYGKSYSPIRTMRFFKSWLFASSMFFLGYSKHALILLFRGPTIEQTNKVVSLSCIFNCF